MRHSSTKIEKRYNQHRDKFTIEAPKPEPGMIGGTGVLTHLPSGLRMHGVPMFFLQQVVANIVAAMTDADLASTDAVEFNRKVRAIFPEGTE